MNTNRIEAFSDGVLAIILTIMVLEFKIPKDHTFAALLPLKSIFISYALSFMMIGIYWNNHHHSLQLTQRANGQIMWANLHLLFWLSLVPFCNGWMGESHFSSTPTFVFGFVLFMSAIAFSVLEKCIINHERGFGVIERAIGKGHKELASMAMYALALPFSFWMPYISVGLFFVVAIMWIIPDRRLEAAAKQVDPCSN